MHCYIISAVMMVFCHEFVLAETLPCLIRDVSRDSVTVRILGRNGRSAEWKSFRIARNAKINRLKDSKTPPGSTARTKVGLSDLQDDIEQNLRGRGMGVEALVNVTANRVTEIGYYTRYADTGGYWRGHLETK